MTLAHIGGVPVEELGQPLLIALLLLGDVAQHAPATPLTPLSERTSRG